MARSCSIGFMSQETERKGTRHNIWKKTSTLENTSTSNTALHRRQKQRWITNAQAKASSEPYSAMAVTMVVLKTAFTN